MFAKLLLVSAFIGYAAAACSMGGFQKKCMKYTEAMQSASQSAQPDITRMCCVVNELVTCTDEQGCNKEMDATITPAKGQMARMCGNFKYVKGCFDKAPAAPAGPAATPRKPAATEAPAAATDAPASAMSALPSLSLIIITTLLLRA